MRGADDNASASMEPLLCVEGLYAAYRGDAARRVGDAADADGWVLRDLSLSVSRGELLAVVGASGAGKSVLADALLGLFGRDEEVHGTVRFEGRPLDASGLAALRGKGISLVPQSVSCLDPLMRVGAQVRGVPRGLTRSERSCDRARRAVRQRSLFAAYGFDRAVEHLYPHELSGGMARRVLLMCALVEEPELLVCDEPTPGLDIDLVERAALDLRAFADTGKGVLMITHDIELALRTADRIAVFYDGRVVEEVPVAAFEDPASLKNPFSRALWHALPENGMVRTARSREGEDAWH